MAERYAGHDSGTECENDGYGNFSYRQLTPAELLARAPAAQIQDDIFKHANSAGVCYYPIFKLIAAAIQAGMDQDRAARAASPVSAPALPSAQAMASEYQEWIDFHAAGNGDYDDFLRQRLKEQS